MAAMRLFPRLVVVALCAGLLGSCQAGSRDRPYGIFRVASVVELAALPPGFINDKDALLIRSDAKGYSAMSLLCTHDLTQLTRTGDSWVSENGSVYALDGKVLKGPAIKELPYYRLYLDRSQYAVPVLDTMYAEVGSEVSPDWRFVIPPECVNGCPIQ